MSSIPSFLDLGVPADLVAVLARSGVTTPFPIQSATLSEALAGRDLCGRAPTGSGKTLAFALAVAMRVEKAAARRPKALILVPTRELATQVCTELSPLLARRGRSALAVFGGTGYDAQRKALRRGVDVVIACPGRLEDLVEQGDVRLNEVAIVVVDEADRMADMGFLPAVRRLLDTTRPDRQTLLFSATLDGDVDTLIRRYQVTPSRHEVESAEEDEGNVEHVFWHADQATRVALTAQLVHTHSRAIVFCRTKHGADRLVRQLAASGVGAVAIHGNRSQGQRERALGDFTAGRAAALVATDVVARGIHVDQIPCVVHFDPPADIKDYVHRSGRTGRAGATGTVVSLVATDQRRSVRTMQRALGLPEGVDQPDQMPRGFVSAMTAVAGPVTGGARPGAASGRPGPGGRPGRGSQRSSSPAGGRAGDRFNSPGAARRRNPR